MKKLFFIVAAFCMTMLCFSCSSGVTSKELQVDAVNIVSPDETTTPSCELFSVVPGIYKVEWAESSVGLHQYAVGITLKLKLEKTQKDINMDIPVGSFQQMMQTSPVAMPGVECERDLVNLMFSSNYGVFFLDANGNTIEGSLPGIGLSVTSDYKQWNEGRVDKDAIERFREFLASEPGTEIEITFGHAAWAIDLSVAERLNDATGIKIVSKTPELYTDFPPLNSK